MARLSYKSKGRRIQRYLEDMFGDSRVSVTFHLNESQGPVSGAPESPVDDATEAPKGKVGVYPFDRPEDMA